MVSPRQSLDIVYLSSFVQLAPGTSNVVLPSPASTKVYIQHWDVSILVENQPGVSRFAPSILGKFGWDHDAEVRALQLVHGRLSIRTPRVLHHAPFPNAVVEPLELDNEGEYGISSWRNAEACLAIPLSMVCPPPNSTT